MQRKRELKFYATNTHQFPLILDAWLQRRGGETTWTNLQTKIFLFWSRTNKKTIHFSKKFLLKRTEEKNGFCDTVFAVLIQKKALEEEDKEEEVRSIDRG
jgi:hypothetical protein